MMKLRTGYVTAWYCALAEDHSLTVVALIEASASGFLVAPIARGMSRVVDILDS